MKKIISTLMAAGILLSVVGCGANTTSDAVVQEPASEIVVGDSDTNKNELIKDETIKLGEWEITPLSYEISDTITLENGMYFEADGDNLFVVPKVNVKNLGTKQAYLYSDVDSKLVYQDEYEYKANAMIGMDGDFQSFSFQPLIAVDGGTAFQLPEEMANSGELALVLEYEDTEYWFYLR